MRNAKNKTILLAAVVTVIICCGALLAGCATLLPPAASPTPEITATPEITPEPTPEATPEPKNIIQQPKDLEVYPSDTARFTVVASKAVKSYMWQYLKPGASWKNVTVTIFPSASTDTLTFIAHDSIFTLCCYF